MSLSSAVRDRTLDYHSIKDLSFEQISFITVPTHTIGEVISEGYDELFKREQYDTLSFGKQLLQLINSALLNGEMNAPNLTLVRRQTKTADQKYYGFVYLDDFQILPLTFERSDNFDGWIAAVSSGIESDEMRFSIKLNGFSTGPMMRPNLFTETAAFLKENAPKSYTKDAEQAKKQTFLSRLKVTDSMHQKIDTQETQRLWKELLSLKNISPTVNEDIEAKFLEFEREAGYSLPDEVQAIYRICDGADESFGDLDLMPMERVTEEWKEWKLIFDDCTLDELTSAGRTDDENVLGLDVVPYWVPIVDYISGNFFGVDLMPGKKGKVGQIIAFGADEYGARRVAKNLNHLLAMMVDMAKDPSCSTPTSREFLLDKE